MVTNKLRCMLFLSAMFSGSMLSAQQLIHYWNFNDNSSSSALLQPTQSLINGSSITHQAGGISTIDVSGGTGQNFNVSNLNARNGDPSGSHLRFNDPIGGALVFALPTTGYRDPVVRFATRRSGSGAGIQYWTYTTDGTNYIPFDTILPVDGNPVLEELDFSAVSAADNNPDFKLSVTFAAGSGGTVGNNRFDNFTVDAHSLSGQDNTPPVATFSPADQSVNIPISTTLSIQFNEPVRLTNGNAIDNSNAASLVSFRIDNTTGATVPFTATFSNNTLSITPTSPLLYRQQYYLALLANVVEDVSGNAITGIQSIQFTTITQQTSFDKGDLAIVAYRMNASNADDEIAILTFADILPGTILNITDAKYTDNAQPQCSGGLTWTSPQNECLPAGSIITIQPDAVKTNKGTLTGGGFGLSSGGDQVIIYSGTAASPNFITALTSNNWVTSNTSCGGSASKIPAGLTDGTNSLNMSTAPGNISGNSPNAYYQGTQTGTPAQLKAAIFNPSNWVVRKNDTLAQEWPDYNFPGPPTVVNAEVTGNTTIRLVFNSDLDPVSATNTNNYSGINNLSTVTITNNGAANDTVTLTYSTPFTAGTDYKLTIGGIANTDNDLMVCPFDFNFTYSAQISFSSTFIVTEEGADTLKLLLNIQYPAPGSVDIFVPQPPFSTADSSDFILKSQTLNLDGNSTTYTIAIAIVDDEEEEQAAEYFAVILTNPVGYTITGDTIATIYIKDNDRVAPTPDKSIELLYVGSFDPSGINNSTCEVVAYDSASKRLLASSGVSGTLDIIDFSDPTSLKVIHSLDINPYGGITSVAVKDGLIAVASPNANEELDGSALFFDINGTFLKQVTVGALPDMITFTPDGTKVLTANEGQPNNDYSIDPEGSISIIDLSAGIDNLTQSQVNTLYFTPFNTRETALIASGIRKTKSTSTLSQDLEPEYIAVSDDSRKAWVTLQENNAIAEIDLQNPEITSLWPLGTKDYSAAGNGFDASDNNNEILIANWPIKAYYIPDAVATYSVNGTNYIITANEGDEKEYGGLVERTTVGAQDYKLDETAFPNASLLKQSFNLGRMRVTNLNGDTDQDGDYDEIYCVGTRSFSIWNADAQELVFDSGDDFEVYTATEPSISSLFNSDHESNSLKSRSRAKGPEPEGITIATLSGKTYAFITLERIGGIMVYDVTDPAEAKFVDYKNSRSVSAYEGDHGPEGAVFIPSSASATGKNYLVVANEISGTLSVFEITDNNDPDEEEPISIISKQRNEPPTFNVFPNPANQHIVYFNRKADVEVFDVSGRLVHKGKNELTLNVEHYKAGIYFVHTHDGAVARLVVRN